MAELTAIKKFVILGGGTAGWMAATTLGNIFKGTDVTIEVIESPNVGIVGVGEATVPLFIDFIRRAGINEVDFIQKTQATFKWGIQFSDWRVKGEDYFHSFGDIGRTIDGHDFYQIWLKSRAMGDLTPLLAHSPEAQLAKHGKFYLPFNAAKTPLANARYALHLDATLVGRYLADYAQSLGVKRREGHVQNAVLDERGFIASLQCDDGASVSADFFIDCSGFTGLLIEQTLQAGYDDWSNWLPCDRAVTVQSKKPPETTPFTLVTARESGWTWRIPLQSRTGNGYVYSSQFSSDQQACNTLLNGLDTEAINEPRVIPFSAGIRRKVWYKNCLALGLAQGFLEPLESTAIHLVSKSLAHFIRLYPKADCATVLQDEFNRRIKADYEEIRDFLVVHYCTSERTDTEFWQYCRALTLPESLQEKLTLFRQQGGLFAGVEDFFQPSSWQMVLTGMGQLPDDYNRTVDALDYEALKRSLASGVNAIDKVVAAQPNHDDFLRQYCQAPRLG
ncbi:tryptophan halogenase family protein [Gilvimarinus polysaccharolyticus]|uniref:tryptophan halogenase family protein n=1 Tax=Gilvimarinus polysaccharolyticus TaxID=863921 RepID=UPI000A719BDF|nr:tryptophan halogenase family protein [Gilvimarinus polysaccharolyticus]